MAGLKALDQLLAGLAPVLYPGDHGYATLARAAVPPALATFAVIAEDEGLTLVALSADLAAECC